MLYNPIFVIDCQRIICSITCYSHLTSTNIRDQTIIASMATCYSINLPKWMYLASWDNLWVSVYLKVFICSCRNTLNISVSQLWWHSCFNFITSLSIDIFVLLFPSLKPDKSIFEIKLFPFLYFWLLSLWQKYKIKFEEFGIFKSLFFL